jgi:transcriptional regulator with XRE-family HTH domain
MGVVPLESRRPHIGFNTPSISDIEELASVLGVEAIDFFPERKPAGKVGELLIAVRGLDEKDLEELIRYAHFRRATSVAR